jgi:hypothetical protein
MQFLVYQDRISLLSQPDEELQKPEGNLQESGYSLIKRLSQKGQPLCFIKAENYGPPLVGGDSHVESYK